MARFTFISEEFAGTKTTVEFHAESMDKVLEHFKHFLQGSGFVMDINDNIELVNRSWEFGEIDSPPEQYDSDFDGLHYTLDDSFSIGDNDIYLNLDDLEQVEPIPEKKKKGKK
jgi:hypothetical protein